MNVISPSERDRTNRCRVEEGAAAGGGDYELGVIAEYTREGVVYDIHIRGLD